MKSTLLYLLFFFLTASLQAQDLVQTIRGTILDTDTKAPLIGANVVVVGSDPFMGTTTDLDGNFRLENVPVGRVNLKFSYIGYLERYVSNLEVNSGKEVVLNIDLEESVTDLEEVVISAEQNKRQAINEMATTSARQFSIEETGRYAGSRNDVSRMAANYAGVSNANDSRNDIVIRGNSPNGLLWRMEGLDIPGPNHFSGVGSNGGPVSMLNYNVISNSDFMTSAFPSEYGNGLSGVFDLSLRNGNNQKREYMFQLGALGTEFMVEGPFSKNYNGSYLVNYRFSTTSILTQMGIDFGFDGTADYQDLSFKVNLPTGKFGSFSLFGLAGNNIYEIEAEERDEESFDESFAENTNDKFENELGIFGLSHLIRVSDKSYLRTVVGFTGKTSTGSSDSVSTVGEGVTPYFNSENSESKISVHSALNTKINAKNKIKTGVIVSRIGYTLEESLYNVSTQQLQPYTQGDGAEFLVQAYSQWQYKFTDQLTFNTGLHTQYFFLNESYAIEPRFGTRWAFAPGKALSLGYGLHSQMQTLPVYLNATNTPNGVVTTNRDLGFTKSHHAVIGYDQAVNENTQLKVEAYYQSLFDVPIHGPGTSTSFSLLNEGASFIASDEDSLYNDGVGRNVGLELTLERYFNRGFYYLVTASLFDSQYKGSDDVWRNTAFNGNYVTNFLAGKEFKVGDNNKIVLDLKVSLAGGRRYTPIDLEASQLAGEGVEIDSEAFSEQQREYFRTDAKITYRINRKKVSHEVFLNVDNLFNNQNVFAQTYSQRTNQIENVYQLGMFPTFQYKILF